MFQKKGGTNKCVNISNYISFTFTWLSLLKSHVYQAVATKTRSFDDIIEDVTQNVNVATENFLVWMNPPISRFEEAQKVAKMFHVHVRKIWLFIDHADNPKESYFGHFGLSRLFKFHFRSFPLNGVFSTRASISNFYSFTLAITSCFMET